MPRRQFLSALNPFSKNISNKLLPTKAVNYDVPSQENNEGRTEHAELPSRNKKVYKTRRVKEEQLRMITLKMENDKSQACKNVLIKITNTHTEYLEDVVKFINVVEAYFRLKYNLGDSMSIENLTILTNNNDYSKFINYLNQILNSVLEYYKKLTYFKDDPKIKHKIIKHDISRKSQTFYQNKFDIMINGIELAQYYSLISNFYFLASSFHYNCLSSTYHGKGFEFLSNVSKYTEVIIDIIQKSNLQKRFEESPTMCDNDKNGYSRSSYKSLPFNYCNKCVDPRTLAANYKENELQQEDEYISKEFISVNMMNIENENKIKQKGKNSYKLLFFDVINIDKEYLPDMALPIYNGIAKLHTEKD